MTSKLRIPFNNESDDCTKLIYISGPNLLSFIYNEKEPKIYELLKTFYKNPGNTFSKENIIIEEENGKIRGLVLAHPVSNLKQFMINELKCIKNTKKSLFNFLITLFKMLSRLKLVLYYPRLRNDEFFICNLAVFKDYRGMGIATKLLEKTEKMAMEKGLNKLSLYVEIDNSNAKRVYEKFGFLEANKAVFPKKYNKYNLLGFIKMIKEIGQN
jgi:ribosomal protein S18 acetylase RimI-like enzyme